MMAVLLSHDRLMAVALEEAHRACDRGEVPIGAVVALDDEIVGRGFNQPISSVDPTAHAEMVAIREAARRLGNYRLTGATLCVTIEPCLMCVGALVHARIARLVFGHHRQPVEGTAHVARHRAQVHLNRCRKTQHPFLVPYGSMAARTARRVSSWTPWLMRNRRPSRSTSSKPAGMLTPSSLTSAKLAALS